MELPDMELVKNLTADEIMDCDGQTEFRSVVGKLTALAHTSRPDICFDLKTLSSRYGKVCKKDLKMALKRMLKVKSETTSLRFPDLGMDLNKWVLLGFGDVGVKSMPDKITSVGGRVILLCNIVTNN
jgi:hypothetical protein